MKKIICPAPGCQDRRIHYTNQDTPRGPQEIEVPDDWTPDQKLVFCSLSCAMFAGAMSASNPQPIFWQEFLNKYKKQDIHFHGEGDPPDFLLEMRESEESEEWLIVYRPEGTPQTDEVKNGMCWEMLEEILYNHEYGPPIAFVGKNGEKPLKIFKGSNAVSEAERFIGTLPNAENGQYYLDIGHCKKCGASIEADGRCEPENRI